MFDIFLTSNWAWGKAVRSDNIILGIKLLSNGPFDGYEVLTFPNLTLHHNELHHTTLDHNTPFNNILHGFHTYIDVLV